MKKIINKMLGKAHEKAKKHGVNAKVFLFLYLGTAPLIWLAIYFFLVDRSITFLSSMLLITAYLLPFGYIYLVGERTKEIVLFLTFLVAVLFLEMARFINYKELILVLVVAICGLEVARYFLMKKKKEKS